MGRGGHGDMGTWALVGRWASRKRASKAGRLETDA